MLTAPPEARRVSFYLRYGVYTHGADEVSLTVSKSALLGPTGQRYGQRITWAIDGRLIADDTAAVVTAKRQLESAYDRDGQDFTFTDSNGTVAHSMQSAGSLSGVVIDEPPSFPDGTGAQLSTYLDYRIVAHCDYGFTAGENPLKSFTETLSFAGGGPRRAVVECTNALPQEQVLSLATAYRCTQSGAAVGLLAYPPIPGPIFPGKEEVAGSDRSFGSPRYVNGVYTDWPVSWSYLFISATPLIGRPNVWPAGG